MRTMGHVALAALLLVGCPKPTESAPQAAAAKTTRGQLPAEAGLPARPDAIPFEPLTFEPPDPAQYRHELEGGIPLWVATSTEFPLVNIRMVFKGGRYLEPADHTGLARMTGSQIRSGGSKSKTPEELDEAFDFLAAQVRTSIGDELAFAEVNCLKDNLDACLDLFVEMVREPRFDAGRTKVYKDGWLAQLAQRNDDASDIIAYEWNALLYGRDHWLGAIPTKSDVGNIDKADMVALHKQIFHPGNLSIEVSGDITADAVKPLLEARFEGWAKGPDVADPPAPTVEVKPGVYHVQKDIPQGKVRIGMRGITRDDPDAIAVEVMNDILGGGGFTSRITKRVRSDEGLAYTARSGFSNRVYFPGQFLAFTESKNETVAFATKIMMDEIARIRTEPVSTVELDTAKGALVETFPRTFESKAATLSTFDDDERTGRDPGFWKSYRDTVSKVGTSDVTRVAERVLKPEEMVILIVGDWEPIAKGDLEGRASMKDLFGGEVTHLPLRDPLTDAPIGK
ncbi:MAG: pitrilysin family protein [Myxococcota bacterium]